MRGVRDLDRSQRNDPVILSGFLQQFPDSCCGSGKWGPSWRGSMSVHVSLPLRPVQTSTQKPMNYWGTVALVSQVMDIFGTDHLIPLPQPVLTVLAILIVPNPLGMGGCTRNTMTRRRNAAILEYLPSSSAENLSYTTLFYRRLYN